MGKADVIVAVLEEFEAEINVVEGDGEVFFKSPDF